MMIASENQLLSIDENCLSDLSEENESTISGGFILGALLGWLIKPFSYGKPSSGGSGGTTIVNNNYNTIYVTTGGSSSGANAGSNSGASTGGGGKGW